MRRGLYFVGAAVGLIACLERQAYAEPEELACTMSSAAVVDKRNQVALHLDERLPANLRTQLSKQLRAVLSERKLVLCTEQPSGGSSGALAKIVLTIEESTSSSDDAIVATMTVRDEVTSKRVARDVDLRGIPDDGRALVLTQVADELLRASWAELLLADAPKPKEPLPDEVKRSIEPAQNPDRLPASNARPLIAIDAGLGGEIFGVGQKQLGASLFS